jgi:PAS domain S-box-containing protein
MALPAIQASGTEFFRRILEQLPLPISHCRDLRYAWVNQPYADWLGRPREEIMGRPIAEVIGAAGFNKLLPHFEQVLSGQSVRYEEEVNFRGLGPRWIKVSYNPLFGEEGSVEGWVAVVNDVTVEQNDLARHRAEDEALRDSHRRKDEFLATLAHELRNPLAPIRNAVEIQRAKGPTTPELEWSRDVIDRQAKHLSRLVDDLLDLSRITLGKIRLENERIPVAGFVVQAVETSRPVIEENGQALTVDLPPEPLFVNGDLTRLSQVVTNLLNNAAKYTPRGGHLRLSVARDEIDPERVCVRVSDTGIGIPEDMLASIFDLFVQVGNPLEHGAGGLGIGLTLAQKVVAKHGGTIEAHSAGPGQGSEFVIRLPLTSQASQPFSSGGPGVDRADVSVSRTHRVLIVDDNSDHTDSLAALLRMAGHEVLTAYDAENALARATAFLPSVVLLDIGMPRMNGHELARRIRLEPWGEATILVALTGWGQADDRRRSREAGIDHHLTKPVEFAAIARLLSRT